MAISVNKTSLLFEGLTPDECSDLFRLTEALVLRGETPPRECPFVAKWIEAGGYDERQWLLLVGVAFPQRALLSLVHAGFKA